jgi:hypothetical protein
MKTRVVKSSSAKWKIGDLGVLQEVVVPEVPEVNKRLKLRDRFREGVSEVEEVYLAVEFTHRQPACEALIARYDDYRVRPFIGKKLGTVATVEMPGGKKVRKRLTEIRKIVQE